MKRLDSTFAPCSGQSPHRPFAQLDFRLVLFTHMKSTFSAGFAAARDRAGHTGTELMFSLKLY